MPAPNPQFSPKDNKATSPEPAAWLQAQKMEMVGRMAGSVIHDLNNLLTVIQLNASLLEDLGDDPGERARMLGEINLACTTASELTRNMLAFSRRKEPKVEPLHLQRLLTDLASFLHCLFSKKAKLVTEFSEVPLWMEGDRAALNQAVMNLIFNALDASGNKEVRLILRAREKEAEIAVTDLGEGIRSEDIPHIFEPFFTTKPADKGTGLGLMIVQRVVDQHHGRVEIESEVGRGSTFRLLFPLATVSPVEGPAAPLPTPPPRRSRRVLLVEDDPGIRRIAAQILQKRGYEILEAGDAEEARAIWRNRGNEIGLLFTDIVLPGTSSGVDLAASLREETPDLPVLFTSGNVGALQVPGQPFLAKPYPPEVLARKVRKLIG